jgi:hypothetical protein
VSLLNRAIEERLEFTFETTLGGHTDRRRRSQADPTMNPLHHSPLKRSPIRRLSTVEHDTFKEGDGQEE